MCSRTVKSQQHTGEHGVELNPVLFPGLAGLAARLPNQELLDRVMKTSLECGDLEPVIRMLFKSMEGNARREFFGDLVYLLMPLDQLVPDVYAEWRPVVRDAVAYIGGSLSEDRIVPKIVEQLMFTPGVSLEKRVVAFISRMPSLQKLGQTIARNRNLNPDFREELVKLENMVRDVTPDQIRLRIKSVLGQLIESHDVRLEKMLHAEASVSAVMGFSWMNPESGQREQGVFKVLKPCIRDFIKEELILMQDLADFLGKHGEDYFLSGVDFKGILDDVRHLMEQEIDSGNEQANLESANQRYHNCSGIRVPQLISELCGTGITAMSFEKGVKVTDACRDNSLRRDRLSARIIEALVAVPLFNRDEEAVFHADPHAGNLFFDDESDDLVIYDWALTDRLGLEERRLMVMLISSVMLRDEYMIYKTVTRLNRTSLTGCAGRSIRKMIRRFVSELSPLTCPGFEQVLALLDSLVITGISFSSPLLIFRKVIMTMSGVLHDMSMKMPLENVLARYCLDQSSKSVWFLDCNHIANRIPLSKSDIVSLYWSAQWLGVRVGMQTGRRLLRLHTN